MNLKKLISGESGMVLEETGERIRSRRTIPVSIESDLSKAQDLEAIAIVKAPKIKVAEGYFLGYLPNTETNTIYYVIATLR